MIFLIIGCARSLSMFHADDMGPPQQGSCVKRAAPKISPPKKNNKKEDNDVPVQSQRARRQRQGNEVHRNAGSLVKTIREP